MLTDGFYKVEFNGVMPGMGGIVTIERGVVRGGDAAFLYSGTLSAGNGRLSGDIRVKGYISGALSVFGVADKFTLTLTGNLIGSNKFQASGPADLPGAPMITIQGTKIANLDLA